MEKDIRIECYDLDEAIQKMVDASSAYSFGAMKELYDVSFDPYGFVHDAGFHIVLRERKDVYDDMPVFGLGWDTFESAFKQNVKDAKDAWDIAAQFAYH